MDERVRAATAVTFDLLYALAIVAMLLMAMPGVRMGLVAAGRRQLHAWRYGRWLAGQRPSRGPPPAWTRELEREQLEREPEWWW